MAQQPQDEASQAPKSYHGQDFQSTNDRSSTIPIALVPHFQLTTVDASSVSMPISDGFSPPAHWQWFATLWRGSVGPDVTIVIKSTDEDAPEGANSDGAVTGGTTDNNNNHNRNTGPRTTSTTASNPSGPRLKARQRHENGRLSRPSARVILPRTRHQAPAWRSD